MIKPVSLLLLAAVLCGSCGSRTGRTAATSCDEPSARPSEYVSTLVGTHSDFTLSTACVVAERVRGFDLASSTPMECMLFISDLKKTLFTSER